MDRSDRPNILFVLVDDMGWGDVGFHGSRISTPNIDRLARTGTELTQHYVCPVCTPTRVCLLTGRNPGRFGAHATVPTNSPSLPDGYETLATMLKNAGYETGLFGKWHLGSDPKFNPSKYGFDHSYGSLAGGVDPYTHLYKKGEFSQTWHRNGNLLNERGHVTDLIADEAVKWLDERSQKKPWFCYVPFTAIHTPIKPPEHWIDRYEHVRFDADPKKDESFKRYAAYTSHMDYNLGRLIETLKTTDQYHNTMVIFTSDNGAVTGEASDVWKYPGWQQDSLLMGSNDPFGGHKNQFYEGGIHTPAIIRWHGVFEPGSKINSPLHMTDWMPTFANLLGIEPKNDPKWDGTDIWDVISRKRPALSERTFYWNLRHENFAIRKGDWKLVLDKRQDNYEPELFNIAADPCEAVNQYQAEPVIVEQLMKELENQRKLDDTSKRPDVD